jgi:hypothetical protein
VCHRIHACTSGLPAGIGRTAHRGTGDAQSRPID